jgi:hypothetical protein
LLELSVGARHAVCVDVRSVEDSPGYVRTTTLGQGNLVLIEFDVWGMDEGGLYYRADFASLEQAVECVEAYVGSPLREWSHPAYPSRPPEVGTPRSHEQFRELLARGGPALPACGAFRTSSDYWLQFLPSGRRDE